MNDPSAAAVVNQLKEAISRLAAPGAEQLAYLTSRGYVEADELALELDDVEGAAVPFLAPESAGAVTALSTELERISGSENELLWGLDALNDAPEWHAIRALARRALSRLEQGGDAG